MLADQNPLSTGHGTHPWYMHGRLERTYYCGSRELENLCSWQDVRRGPVTNKDLEHILEPTPGKKFSLNVAFIGITSERPQK